MSLLSCLSSFMNSQIASELGGPFNVYRPKFNQVDQTPTLVQAGVILSVNPGGGRYAVPSIGGVNYYTVVGIRSFMPGDILVSQDPNSTIPTLTVLNYSLNHPCIAFRTSRIGKITFDDVAGNELYTNLYYDYISTTTPGAGMTEDLMGALNIANKRMVLWARPNIQTQFAQGTNLSGLRIYETDGTQQYHYVFKSVTNIGNLIVVSIDEEVGN